MSHGLKKLQSAGIQDVHQPTRLFEKDEISGSFRITQSLKQYLKQ